MGGDGIEPPTPIRFGEQLRLGVSDQIEIALTSLVAIALLYGLLQRNHDVRVVAAILAAFGCLYQGPTTLPVLTHGIALTARPTTAARVGVAAILGLGAARSYDRGPSRGRPHHPNRRRCTDECERQERGVHWLEDQERSEHQVQIPARQLQSYVRALSEETTSTFYCIAAYSQGSRQDVTVRGNPDGTFHWKSGP